jgi:hypothetical protein
MNLPHQIPANKCISFLMVENDKPLVGGILFYMKKVCSTCKKEKDINAFSKCRGEFRARCKDCCNEYYKKTKAKPELPVIDLHGETWKDITGFEGQYQVSNKGRIKTLARTFIVKSGKRYRRRSQLYKQHDDCKRGYLKVMLHKNGKHQSFFVHRLVGIAFIPNQHNKRTINHKDGIKTNNNVENLEWATDSEQIKHSFDKLNRIKPLLGKFGKDHHTSKPVNQYSTDGEFIKRWDSIVEADRAGISWASNIGRCVMGATKTAGGFKWKSAGKNDI